MSIRPLADRIIGLVSFGEHKTESGIVISVNDNAKSEGIRARWAKIWQVGSNVTDVKSGDWVLVEHGRWSMKTKVTLPSGKDVEFMQLDPKALMGMTDSRPPNIPDIEFD